MTRPVVVSVEAKRSALDRIAKGEAVSAVAADLGIHRQRLYYWQTRVRKDGLEALRGPGRPPKPVLDKRPHLHGNVLLMAALKELLTRLARTTGEPPGDSR